MNGCAFHVFPTTHVLMNAASCHASLALCTCAYIHAFMYPYIHDCRDAGVIKSNDEASKRQAQADSELSECLAFAA